MGIFSLFGKKDRQPAKPAEKDASRAQRSRESSGSPPSSASSSSSASRNAGKAVAAKRDASTAIQTALKIDAIETEMSIEYVNLPLSQRSRAKPAPSNASSNATAKAAPAGPQPESAPHRASGKPTKQHKADAPTPALAAPATLQPLGPGVGSTTEFLLDGQTAVSNMATPSSEGAAVVEEAAIMYANGQAALTTQMLQAALASDNLGELPQTAWLMLLDLHQVGGRQAEFEELAIDYASRFETSPPAWTARQPRSQAQVAVHASASTSNSTPTVPFSGRLDGGCEKQIERIRNLAEKYRTLRLEFVKVTEVDPAGCRLLLAELRRLQKSGHDLVLVGAAELAGRIRAIIEVGRRDDTEDCWLLLLEVLQLLNREMEFEELSIDYCVTFEVSPPAFVPPPQRIVTALAESPAPAPSEHFMMPALVAGQVDELILAIAAYSDEHDPAIIDCSCLERMDFGAASRLLTGLSPFCGSGKVIEFHHVNHLVGVLLQVIGLNEIIRVVPRRN